MIGPDQVVSGVVAGLILILLRLVPGLIQSLVDGLTNCASLFSSRYAFLRHSRVEIPQPRWFAVVGVGIIVVTFAAYYAE
jgi:hypothetical protein